jgi:murein L,D-transpeptidase YcbB/YkuD
MIKFFFPLFSLFLISLGVSGQNSVKGEIEQILSGVTDTANFKIDDDKLFRTDYVLYLYKLRDFKPLWKKQRELCVDIINSSYDEGLSSEDYHIVEIQKLRDALSKKKDASVAAKLDILMSDAILEYSYHLIKGKVDQSKIREGWDVPPNKLPRDGIERVINGVEHDSLEMVIEGFKPQNFMYKYLKKGLARYRKIERNGGWPKVETKKVLKKDVKDTAVLTLRKYLTITGDMDPALKSVNDTVFDTIIEQAVKNFQFRHNLTMDGIVGKGTLAEINVPVEDRIDQIRINMERARWVMHQLPNDFVVANIAGFNVRRLINDSIVNYSRAIVGKKFHESPIFRGKIQYIVLNPTWTVPFSIAVKEMLPKIKKDKNYLPDHYLELLDRSGNPVNPETVDFNTLSSSNFPYTIRQKAGPHNALGQVKFIFPNKYSVYMHDTPARSLFSREKRAFSHGCIRLDKKWELFFSLVDDPAWDEKRLREVLDSQKTTTVMLKEPEEILILYWTAGADKKNRLFFNEDVYGRDAAVLKQLNKTD